MLNNLITILFCQKKNIVQFKFRFVAICFPYKYRSLFSIGNVKKIIFFIWSFAVCYPISGIIPWSKNFTLKDSKFTLSNSGNMCANYNRSFFVVSFLGIYIVPLTIMTITYVMILQIALTQIRAIDRTQLSIGSMQSNKSFDSVSTVEPNETSGRMKNKRRQKELHATKSVAIVYSAFLVCWFPVCVVNIILLFDVRHFPRLLKTNKHIFLFVWYFLVQILPAVNTMVNPLIYSFSNRQFRIMFKSVYTRIIGKSNLKRPEERKFSL